MGRTNSPWRGLMEKGLHSSKGTWPGSSSNVNLREPTMHVCHCLTAPGIHSEACASNA